MVYDPFFLHLDPWPAWAAPDQPPMPEVAAAEGCPEHGESLRLGEHGLPGPAFQTAYGFARRIRRVQSGEGDTEAVYL